MFKKIISMVLALVCVLTVFTACSTSNSSSNSNSDEKQLNDKKLNIVCTIFPEYDWVKQILGENIKNADLTMLLDNGVDLHSYQPTADDIIKISSCDLFIYVGGESDAWVEDALKEKKNKNMKVVNLLDVLGDTVKEEQAKEGMEAEKDEDNDGESTEEVEYDEHVWLSLKNAKTLCSNIAKQLCDIDSDNSKLYNENLKNYTNDLDKLDNDIASATKTAKYKTLIFGDRFPFLYFVNDYNLDYYAAFVGCSAETEASFKTIKFLANKVDELNVPAVMTIEGAEHKIAQTVVNNTKSKNQKILTLDSMQATTSKDVHNGETYLKVMQNNFNVLKQAIN